MDANKIDVDALFKQYTIKEIQTIELQVKNEIEKKKEDLRIMVYNRYRDIIDAADGIHVMQSCSKQIENVLSELQSTCSNVFSNKENSKFIQQEKQRSSDKNKRSNKYVLAVIIKILQNSPSKIWYHLDNHEYIKAAKQYLLAQHAHICIELEDNLKSLENSASYIQYAHELWSSIVFLSKTIASKARGTFTDLNIDSSKVLVNAMSAIYLLENLGLKQIFHEFMAKRSPVIKKSIDIDTSDANVSIKERILKCLKSFVSTVSHVFNLFVNDADNEFQSFENSINEMAFMTETLKDDGFVITKIPDYLKNVKFKETSGMQKFDADYLSDECTKWLEVCLKELRAGFESTFKYLKSLKNLVEIRDVVVEFESKIEATGQDNNGWSRICGALFKKDIRIWSELIAPFYYDQSKVILETRFATTKENLLLNLNESLSNNSFDSLEVSNELDINSFMWSSENSTLFPASKTSKNSIDFISSRFSSPSKSHTTTLTNGPGLNNSNKQNITPTIKNLCKSLDTDVELILTDIEFTTKFNKSHLNNATYSASLASLITKDFDHYNENLEVNLKKFSSELCQSLRELVEALGASDDIKKIKKILFISRFLNALVSFASPQLKNSFSNVSKQVVTQRKSELMSRLSDTNDVMQILTAVRKKTSLTDQKNNDQNWAKFSDELQQICKIGFKIWIESICNEIKQAHLLEQSDSQKETVLAISDFVAWDEIEIEDELNSDPITAAEQTDATPILNGSEPTAVNMKSKLHVPLVCSPLIQTILYTLCQELTKNLPYNMIDTNLILKDLISKVFELIINFYKDLIKNNNLKTIDHPRVGLTQNQALQILFDLRFMHSLFEIKSTSDKNILTDFKMISADLEVLVDPFDYDICLPFIQSNIIKALARTSALYGILSINERIPRTNPVGSTLTTANDKFNLIVLSNSQCRFELLPLPSQQSQNQINLEKQQQILLKNQAANLRMDKTKSSSTGKHESVNSASTGLSNVFKWFQ